MTAPDSPSMNRPMYYSSPGYNYGHPIVRMTPEDEAQLAAGFAALNSGCPLPTKVFVGGLAERTNERDLREIFSGHAEVQEVKIITDRTLTSKTGEPRRYAFIAFDNEEQVQKVLAEFKNKELDLHGRKLNIGSAFRKVPSYGRLFGSGLGHQFIQDPYYYAPQMATNWIVPPKSPYQARSPAMQPQYYVPVQYAQPQYVMAPPSPSPILRGAPGSPINVPPSPMAYPMNGHMNNIASMSQDVRGVMDNGMLRSPTGGRGDLYNGQDRTAGERYIYGNQSLQQLPAGHVDVRPRVSGRSMALPTPIRTQPGQDSSGYAQGMDDSGFLSSGQNMRHQYSSTGR